MSWIIIFTAISAMMFGMIFGIFAGLYIAEEKEELEEDKNKYIHIDDVYRLIAGHSIYGGDSILSAFGCLTEGKEVKPIKPLDITYYKIDHFEDIVNELVFEKIEKIKTELSRTTYFNHINGRDERLLNWEETKTILDKHIKENKQ